MAKLDSPFGAKKVSGRIGDGFVMSSWRGSGHRPGSEPDRPVLRYDFS